jgi:hypothetical protein
MTYWHEQMTYLTKQDFQMRSAEAYLYKDALFGEGLMESGLYDLRWNTAPNQMKTSSVAFKPSGWLNEPNSVTMNSEV